MVHAALNRQNRILFSSSNISCIDRCYLSKVHKVSHVECTVRTRNINNIVGTITLMSMHIVKNQS